MTWHEHFFTASNIWFSLHVLSMRIRKGMNKGNQLTTSQRCIKRKRTVFNSFYVWVKNVNFWQRPLPRCMNGISLKLHATYVRYYTSLDVRRVANSVTASMCSSNQLRLSPAPPKHSTDFRRFDSIVSTSHLRPNNSVLEWVKKKSRERATEISARYRFVRCRAYASTYAWIV